LVKECLTVAYGGNENLTRLQAAKLARAGFAVPAGITIALTGP